MAVNIFARSSRAGNGCADFMGAPIKFLVAGRGYFRFWGGKHQLQFYGLADFSEYNNGKTTIDWNRFRAIKQTGGENTPGIAMG